MQKRMQKQTKITSNPILNEPAHVSFWFVPFNKSNYCDMSSKNCVHSENFYM